MVPNSLSKDAITSKKIDCQEYELHQEFSNFFINPCLLREMIQEILAWSFCILFVPTSNCMHHQIPEPANQICVKKFKVRSNFAYCM